MYIRGVYQSGEIAQHGLYVSVVCYWNIGRGVEGIIILAVLER